MSTATHAPVPTRTRPRSGLTPAGFRALVSMHIKIVTREPGYAFTIVIPLVILIIVGSIPGAKTPEADLGHRSFLDVYVPTLAAMVPLMVACTGLPGVMVAFRERNALRRFRVSPVPSGGMLAALVAVLSATAVIGVLIVLVLGLGVFGAARPAHIGAVVSAYVLGFAAVMAVGMVVAAVAPTAGVANGMAMPFMVINFFFSGLYVPTQQLSSTLQTIGEFVPFGAVTDAWSGQGVLWQHLAVLAGYTVVGAFASAKLFRWE